MTLLGNLATRFGRRAALAAGGAAALAAASLPFTSASHSSVAPSSLPLDPSEWRALRLASTSQLTRGDRPTKLMRFELPPGHAAIPVASCLLVRAPVGSAKEDGTRAFVMRPYTPVSKPDDGFIDLAIKIYPGGKLTPHLAAMQPGESAEFKGPLPKLPIEEAAKKKSIGMVAGGTGITPMLQLAEELLRQKYAGQISLVYANVSPADIMLKGTVDALAARHANFRVFYLVDKSDGKQPWGGGVGFVTPALLKARLPPPSADSLVLVCGPPGMMKVVSGEKKSPREQGPLEGMLAAAHYTAEQVVKF